MNALTFTYAVQYRLDDDQFDGFPCYWSEEFDEDYNELQTLGVHGEFLRVNKLLAIWENRVDSYGDYFGVRIFDSMMLDRPKSFYSRFPECFRDAPAKLSEYGLIELAMLVLHELHELGVGQAESVSQFRL